MDNYDLSTQQIVNRVDPQAAALDPATITMIISAVLPMLLDCFQRQTSAAASDMNAKLAQAYKENPHRVLRLTSYQVRMQSRREGKKISKDQADLLARAIIDEALEPANSAMVGEMASELFLHDDAE